MLRRAALLLLLTLAAPAEGGTINDPELGVTLVWAKETQTVTSQKRKLVCGPPYKEEVEAALPIITQLLKSYGKETLSRARLKGIRFCRDLIWKFPKPVKRVINGAVDIRSEQAVGGLAVYSESRVYVDVAAALRGRAVDVLLHHELFHFIDLTIADSGFRGRWASQNPASFRYGGGGLSTMGGKILLPGEYPGFVSAYATSSQAEDRAELYAWWRAKTGALRGLLRKDQALRAKVQLLGRQLQKRYPDLVRRLPRL